MAAGIYKTPGVYVEEIPKLPPSIAPVETAIPAFIGYTERDVAGGEDLKKKPVRIASLREYESIFGFAASPKSIEVTLNADNQANKVSIVPNYYLYNSLVMFYANGGGPCYIVTVGKYSENGGVDDKELIKGIEALTEFDEPTLIVVPDSVLIGDAAKLGGIHAAALKQCADLQDRFAILDLLNGDKKKESELPTAKSVAEVFRNNISLNLKYGAAYYPFIRTTLTYDFSYKNVVLKKADGTPVDLKNIITGTIASELDAFNKDTQTIRNKFYRADGSLVPTFNLEGAPETKAAITANAAKIKAFITAVQELAADTVVTHPKLSAAIKARVEAGSELQNVARQLAKYDYGYADAANAAGGRLGIITEDAGGVITDFKTPFDYGLDKSKDASIYAGDDEEAHFKSSKAAFQGLFDQLVTLVKALDSEVKNLTESFEKELQDQSAVYAGIVNKINREAVTLPPSGAIAGIYASVDNSRGVWKAPANVGIANVVGPSVNVTDEENAGLNVHETGKSINVIRAFTGRGTLVWGARTLAGNDNEWRYVNVRRFFNFVEESVKKASGLFVFEPNDANTWVKVQAMIENFLNTQWRQGALQGVKPEHAFYVAVGLGKTMTPLDILEGRMIIEIGMAAVRPAEFIILRFSHKMAES
ncbi:MAG: phage tail sheath C-terminal domain-containing protein [Spirosomataceae bacterium]